MYPGIFKHLILFKSELNNSKYERSALLALIDRLLLFYLKLAKNSTGIKMLNIIIHDYKCLKRVLLLFLSGINSIKYHFI
jgi:hypothetical protein